MGILCTVVKPLMRPVLDMRHDLALCRSIRAQLIGDHALGCNALLLQQTAQQAPGGLGMPTVLHDLIEMPDIIMRRQLAV